MIPKVIHYCWFGGNPLPEMAIKCIESWKKYCPEYKIIEWNEKNFDINSCEYVREAYESKKYAFVSDVVRLYAISKYGGIYMDTDVEVIKPLDSILKYKAVSGFEAEDRIPTGLMACEANHPFFLELYHEYDNERFINEDNSFNTTTNVTRITNACLKHGLVLNNHLQTVNDFTLFPNDYFCPKNYHTGIVNITNNTLTIHHFEGSWLSEDEKYKIKLKNNLSKYFPEKISSCFAGAISSIKYNGIMFTIKKVINHIFH